VSIDATGVTEIAKLHAAQETIEYIRKAGGIVTLATHLGRPKGEVVSSLSTSMLVPAIEKVFGAQVIHIDQFEDDWQEQVSRLSDAQIGVLENVQFSPGEVDNSKEYAKRLAAPFDLFVMDCFGQSHRAYASIVGIPAYLPSAMGLLVKKELLELKPLLEGPKKPFVAIIGGAKMSTKLPVIHELSKRADAVVLGGGIVNTVLAAAGYKIGASICDQSLIRQAKKITTLGRVLMPVDVIVGKKDGSGHKVVRVEETKVLCTEEEMILDIGPESVRIAEALVARAGTILWNGALGYFEQEPYHAATQSLVLAIAQATEAGVHTVIGGGETLQAMNLWSAADAVSFASTGGGAMLTLLSGKTLPGIAQGT